MNTSQGLLGVVPGLELWLILLPHPAQSSEARHSSLQMRRRTPDGQHPERSFPSPLPSSLKGHQGSPTSLSDIAFYIPPLPSCMGSREQPQQTRSCRRPRGLFRSSCVLSCVRDWGESAMLRAGREPGLFATQAWDLSYLWLGAHSESEVLLNIHQVAQHLD